MSTRADPALAYPLAVYYDASCPLCRTEIETLKARDVEDLLYLVDCSTGVIAFQDVTREDMMARIHARDATGRWLRGIDVFAAVYRAAGLRILARIYASPRLRPLLDRVYPWIADHRQLLSRLGLSRLFHFVPLAAPRCDDACAREPKGPATR
jgi:predicted DCC family thiol-disulfide oxidoreductase YuxK